MVNFFREYLGVIILLIIGICTIGYIQLSIKNEREGKCHLTGKIMQREVKYDKLAGCFLKIDDKFYRDDHIMKITE